MRSYLGLVLQESIQRTEKLASANNAAQRNLIKVWKLQQFHKLKILYKDSNFSMEQIFALLLYSIAEQFPLIQKLDLNIVYKMQTNHCTVRYYITPWILVMVSLIMLTAVGHQKVIIDSGTKTAEGLINRMISIDMDSANNSKYIHAAMTAVPDDSKYIVVHPATIYPIAVFRQNFLMLPTNSLSLLDELRSYQSAHYKDVVVVGEFIFLHLLPNKIVIVREKTGVMTDEFHVENSYELDGLTLKSETKMYKIKNGKEIQVLLVVINTNFIYKLSTKQSYKYTLPRNNQISHLQFIADNEFVAATKSQGIKFYRIKAGTIQIMKQYTCANMGLNSDPHNKQKALKDDDILRNDEEVSANMNKKANAECYIPDISLNSTTLTLYILDEKSGLYEAQIKKQQSIQLAYDLTMPRIITKIKDCEALDTVSSDHFVLVCQVAMPNSYIQQIMRFPDPVIKDKFVYIKKQPFYHDCNLNDLVVTQDFFLIFDSYTIDVFWNSLKSGSYNELSTEHTKQHFNIAGLEVFTLSRNQDHQLFLYVVESNMLIKYQLVVFKGRIFAYSPTPIKKEIKVQVPGQCNQSNHQIITNNKEINQNVECFYEMKVLLNIQEKIQVASKEKVSMSVGAIVLMLAVMLILTWICLVKYRGLESHARKILEKYRQRNRYDENKFTI